VWRWPSAAALIVWRASVRPNVISAQGKRHERGRAGPFSELAQALASALTLFRGHFPAARANVTPGATIRSPAPTPKPNRSICRSISRAGAPAPSAALCWCNCDWTSPLPARVPLAKELQVNEPRARPSAGPPSPWSDPRGSNSRWRRWSPGRPRLLGVVARGLTYESEALAPGHPRRSAPSGSDLPRTRKGHR
jgi:hypothetical protein